MLELDGLSVVGKQIKVTDFGSQQMNGPVDIFIERIDSVLSDNVLIPLMKLDAQGFQCQILDGMSPEISANINQIKFEISPKWLDQQGCTNILCPVFAILDSSLLKEQEE